MPVLLRALFVVFFSVGSVDTAIAQQPPADPRTVQDCASWEDAARRTLSAEEKAQLANCRPLIGNYQAHKGCMEQWGENLRRRSSNISEVHRACLNAVKQNRARDEHHARIAAQNDQNQRALQQQLQSQRITSIPVQPIEQPQRTTVIPNHNNSGLQQQQAEAVGALAGMLLSKLFSSRVEKELGTGQTNNVTQQIEANNARGWELFDKARDRLNTHPAIKVFQDMAFDQLNNQVRVVAEQMSNLDRDVDKIIGSTPRVEAVKAALGRRLVAEARVADFKDPVGSYDGQTDPDGRPHGLGVFTQSLAGGARATHTGVFVSGRTEGFGTYEHVAPDGRVVTMAGDWQGDKVRGSLLFKDRDKNGAMQYDGPDSLFDDEKPIVTGRITFRSNARYEGELQKADGDDLVRPRGVGIFSLPNRSSVVQGRFGRVEGTRQVVENATVRRPDGTTQYCPSAVLEGHRYVSCSIPYKQVEQNGGYTVFFDRKDAKEDVSAWIRYEPSGDGKVGWIDEYLYWIDAEVDVRRRTWSNGEVYEGQFRKGNWTGSTIGTVKSPNGLSRTGKWENRELVDGYRLEPNGTRVPVGLGTDYALPRIALR